MKERDELDFIFDELDQMSEEELNREMDKILAEVEADEEVANVEAPKELYYAVSKGIEEIENARARERLSDEDKELLQYGRLYKKQLKYRKYGVLVAALILALSMGITSMGGPRRLMQRMTGWLSGREQAMVDSNDGSISNTSGWTEEEAYDEIEEKFGIRPVQLIYLPEDVKFEEFQIGNEIQGAQLFYTKDEKLSIRMHMQMGYTTGSHGFYIEDTEVQTYSIENELCEIVITEYIVEENDEQRWKASFEFEEVSYGILGYDMNQDEFEKIINNLYFMK